MNLKSKFYSLILGVLSVVIVYLFVKFGLSKNSLQLFSVWINTILFTALIISILYYLLLYIV